MIKEIAELINNNYNQIRNNDNYFIKVEIGKYHSSEIFEQSQYLEGFIEYLNLNKKYKILNKKECYQYQQQNHIYQRERTFKSHTFTDNLIDSTSFSDKKKNNSNDYRISLHHIAKDTIFTQQMNYHNIVFIIEQSWQITDNCQLYIINQNKKTLNQNEMWYEVFFKIRIPISEISLKEIESEIFELEKLFKRKYDKKCMFHSLDLVVEYEQPHQDEVPNNEPLRHHEE
jgi:hypothetical protein